MPTSRTCTTPKDGWSLYSHFLGNLLSIIRLSCKNDNGEETEEQKNSRECLVSTVWAQLTGHLYMIMRRMQKNGYHEDATKMQQLVDMTIELDLTDPVACEAMHNKHKELRPY